MPSNNVKIIDAVRAGRNRLSRKDVAIATKLAWGTMFKTVEALLAADLIFARSAAPAEKAGRPKIPLCVNADGAYFCGIDIGSSRTRIVFCDLNFHILYRSTTPTEFYTTPERFKAWLLDFYRASAAGSWGDGKKISGIGLAVSGRVDSERSLIISGGNFGMKAGANVDMTDFAAAAGHPVLVIPTMSAAACAEYRFGRRAGCDELVAIGLGVGIGAGVVSGGEVLIGSPGRPVGLIGHMLMPDNPRLCTCGFSGCIEAYSGGGHLRQVAAELLPDRPSLHDAAALDAAAACGDAAAAAILDVAAGYNAVGMATMLQIYAPRALVFYGGQSRPEGFLFRSTIEHLGKLLPPERRSCDISVTDLGETGPALGAARLAYEKFC